MAALSGSEQKAPGFAGHNYSQKEKPHRTCPQTFGTNPMRLAQGWAGVRRRAAWFYNVCRTIPDQVRVLFSSPETPDNYRYLNPRRERLEPSDKNPSAATNREKKRATATGNIGSRKHALSLPAHSFSVCLLQQRAGLQGYFTNSKP
jgi:hypothetical protein